MEFLVVDFESHSNSQKMPPKTNVKEIKLSRQFNKKIRTKHDLTQLYNIYATI